MNRLRAQAAPLEVQAAEPAPAAPTSGHAKDDQASAFRWAPASADALIAEVQARRRQLFSDSGWPDDRDARRRLAAWMDAFDATYLARDLAALRRLAAEFPAGPGRAISPAEDAVLRVIERDQGLPEGSLAFYTVAICDKNREAQGEETSRAAGRSSPALNLPFPDVG
jgi:hypothetical protein